MSDNRSTAGSGKPSAEGAWEEVGRRFESLGRSLADAVSAAWSDEANQKAVNDVAAGIKSMAKDVADSVDEAARSPEGQKLRQEAEELTKAAAETGKQTFDEAKPQLVAALRSITEGLQSAISHLSAQEDFADR